MRNQLHRKAVFQLFYLFGIFFYPTIVLSEGPYPSPFGDEYQGLVPPPMPGYGGKDPYTLETVDGKSRIPRCTTYDSSPLVSAIPWRGQPQTHEECVDLDNLGQKVSETIIQSCKQEYVGEKIDPWINLYWKGLDWNSPMAVISSIQEWPNSLKGFDLAKGIAVQFAKCVTLGWIDAMNATPGSRAALKRIAEAGFETYAIYETVTGLKEAYDKAHQVLGSGSKWSAGFLSTHIAASVTKLYERCIKIAAPLWESDYKKYRDILNDKTKFDEKALKECKPEEVNLTELDEHIQKMSEYLSYLRTEFAYGEKAILCARYLRLYLRDQGPSPELMGLLDRSETIAHAIKLVNDEQCEIAKWLSDVHELKTKKIPELTRKKDTIKAEYQMLARRYFEYERNRCNLNDNEIADAKSIIPKLRSLRAKECGGDMEPDPDTMLAFSEPHNKDDAKVQELRLAISQAIEACDATKARAIFSELKSAGNVTNWGCHLSEVMSGYEESLKKIEQDRKAISSYLSTEMPSAAAIKEAIARCDYHTADRLVLAAVEKSGGPSGLNYPACFNRYGREEATGQVFGLRKLNDERRAAFQNAAQASAAALTQEITVLESFFDLAAQDRANRCSFLQQAIGKADSLAGATLAPPFSACPASDDFLALKQKVTELAGRAKEELAAGIPSGVVEQVSSLLDSCEIAQAAEVLAGHRPFEGICEASIRAKLSLLDAKVQEETANASKAEGLVLATHAKASEAFASCNLDKFNVLGVALTKCQEKALTGENKVKYQEIESWRSALSQFQSNKGPFIASVERAKSLTESCSLAAAEGAVAEANSKFEGLAQISTPACVALLPVGELKEVEAKLKRLVAIKREVFTKYVTLDATVNAVKLELAGQEPGPHVEQMLRGKLAALNAKLGELEGIAGEASCDREVQSALAKARAQIASVRAPALSPSQTQVTGNEFPPEDSPDDEIDATIDSILGDAEDVIDAEDDRTRTGSQGVGSRVSAVANSAGEKTSTWTPPEDPGLDPIYEAARRGKEVMRRRQPTGNESYPELPPVYGSSNPGELPPSAQPPSVYGRPSPGGRGPASPGVDTSNPGSANSACEMCRAEVRKVEQQSRAIASQHPGSWDPGNEEVIARWRAGCDSVCR